MNPIALYDENTSIHDVGNFIMAYEARQNAFCHSLVNRIGMVLVTSRLWNNKLARYKKGLLELGETVEEIFVNIAKPFSYDPSEAEQTWMKRELPDVRAAFHTMNYQKMYKVTIQRNDLSKAFLSWSNVDALISYIVDSLYTAMNYDEFIMTKYLVARYLVNGHMKTFTVGDPTTKEGNEDLIKKVRAEAVNVTYLSSDYNQAGVMNSVDSAASLNTWIDSELNANTDVDVLAKAYNMDKADFIGRMMVLNSLSLTDEEQERASLLLEGDFEPFTAAEETALESVKMVAFDDNFLMIFDNLNEMNQQPNGQGLYWQYWLHAWRTFSISPFAVAYALTTATNAATAVTIAPATANMTPGSSMTLSATVAGSGLYSKDVTWSITGQTKSGTTIDPSSGLVHIAADEVVGTKVTAKATADGGVSKTAVITVVA